MLQVTIYSRAMLDALHELRKDSCAEGRLDDEPSGAVEGTGGYSAEHLHLHLQPAVRHALGFELTAVPGSDLAAKPDVVANQ